MDTSFVQIEPFIDLKYCGHRLASRNNTLNNMLTAIDLKF